MDDKLLPHESALLIHLDRTERFFLWFFGGAFALFLFFYAIQPIYDPDFWWHLKSGEFMAENGGLLSSDPFTFTGDGVLSAREALILKGYWLWQLTAYAFYALLGFNGIFLFNFLMVGATAVVVARQMLRQQVSYPLAIVLMTLGFSLLRAIYPLERPQVVSFLLAAILLALLSGVRAGGKLGWTLPLLMMIWANLHGGFVVGDIILLAFAAGVVIEYRHDLPRLRHLLGWVTLALGASLLNPNGPLAFGEVFSFYNSAAMTGVSEYKSTWVKFQNGSSIVTILWLLIALYGLGCWVARRLYWPELIVALFLAYISVTHVRNIGFFAVAMLPAVGSSLQAGLRQRHWQFPSLPALLLSLCAGLLLWSSYGLWRERQGVGPVKLICPEEAITFIQTSGLSGRMFNDYTYGGYLLWRLSPQTRIFIDGRGLETGVYDDYQKLAQASEVRVDGRREYEALLDRYAIDYVIQPIYDMNGVVQPLMMALLPKPDWIPVYLDGYAYILVRYTAANAEMISAHRMDKNAFKSRLLQIYTYICQNSPRWVNPQIARAGLLLYLGMPDEASAQIEGIKAIAPNNQALPALQRDLALLRAKRL